jgi:hypothetical protein
MPTSGPSIYDLVCKYSTLAKSEKDTVKAYISRQIETILDARQIEPSAKRGLPKRILKDIVATLSSADFTTSNFGRRLPSTIQARIPKKENGPTAKVINYFEKAQKAQKQRANENENGDSNEGVYKLHNKTTKKNSQGSIRQKEIQDKDALRRAYKLKANELYTAGEYAQAYYLYSKAKSLQNDDTLFCIWQCIHNLTCWCHNALYFWVSIELLY